MISAMPDEYGSLAPITVGTEDSALAVDVHNANAMGIVMAIIIVFM
jgi:hypothetical protein